MANVPNEHIARNPVPFPDPVRAAALSDEQLAQIASKAAKARWANRPIKAIHKGNFKKEFGVDVECYVLDDERKTAVLSERGMSRALGFSATGGNRLKEFLATKRITDLAGREMVEKISQPIVFEWDGGGRETAQHTVHGFKATLLIDVCKLISKAGAAGKLPGRRYENIIAQARIILDASANLGIDHLVYALSGYNPSAEEVIAAFKLYVQEEARKYEKEFPPELYAEWHRLYDIPKLKRGRSWHFKHLTVNNIYYPLARSSGKVLVLLRALKSKGGDRNKKLFQFLSEIGARALRIQMGRVLEMAESSPNKETFETKAKERFGEQRELPLEYGPRAA